MDHLVLGAAYIRQINVEMGNPLTEEDLVIFVTLY